MRHTYATYHYNENKDLVLLENQYSYNSMETTSLYTNIDDTKRRAAIERLEQRQLEESDEINT
ncbi:hypothetical protein ABE55_00865 [Bacillus thuringiensis]|nr:hypothetical protein [Bacillus thuringiensis]